MAKKSEKIYIDLPERVDTFNLENILAQVAEGLRAGHGEVTLVLSQTRFVNLPFIKKLAQLASDAASEGQKVVLLNASEKVKVQIGIFADLKVFSVKRAVSKHGWPVLDGNADF